MLRAKYRLVVGLFFLVMAVPAPSMAAPDVVRPQGDENLGNLLVKAPSWGSAEEANAFPYGLLYRGSTFYVDKVARLTAGDGCLDLTSDELATPQRVCGLRIEKKQTTEFQLSGLVVSWDANSSDLLKVDVGFPGTFVVNKKNGGNLSQLGREAWSGSTKRGLAILPGTYEFSWGVPILGKREETINAGQTYRANITPPDMRATVLVRVPERVFPDFPTERCENSNRHFLVLRSSPTPTNNIVEPVPNGSSAGISPEIGMLSWVGMSPSKDRSFKVFPFPPEEKVKHYTYVLNNITLPLDVAPGRTTEVVVKRIDVDDVRVTTETGKDYITAGTYQVFRKNPQTGKWDVIAIPYGCKNDRRLDRSRFPTKTGLDVPPGTYRVVAGYSTAEGPKVTDDYIIEL